MNERKYGKPYKGKELTGILARTQHGTGKLAYNLEEKNHDRIREGNPIPATINLLTKHPIAWLAGAVYFAGCALIGVEFWVIRRGLNARDKALDVLMKRAEDDNLALRTLY